MEINAQSFSCNSGFIANLAHSAMLSKGVICNTRNPELHLTLSFGSSFESMQVNAEASRGSLLIAANKCKNLCKQCGDRFYDGVRAGNSHALRQGMSLALCV